MIDNPASFPREMSADVKTGATLFSGFDGVGIGMRATGIRHLWGIEWRDDVAQVARDNGFHSITADILTVDPRTMERVDFLHASPPCTNASVANAKAGETELDKALAYKTAEFVEVLRPNVFTLENVWQYRNFHAFKFILTTLERLGYWIDVQHVNSADFGVPQTRRRMILRARLGGWIPHLPDPVRWVGWYEAIEDLIPTLPESHFAPWQLERLPEEYKTILVHCSDMRSMPVSQQEEPSFTVLAAKFGSVRAYLVAGVNGGTVEPEEPAQTVLSSAKTVEHRAFLVNTREMHGNDGAGYTAVGMGDPSYTVASSSEPNRHRAFLVNGALSTSGDDKTLQIHASGEPGGTVVSTMSSVKDTRVFSNGRVVSMTPRALARFQSFPDWYELPTKKALACYGIGNAVPPLMMQRIYEQFTDR